MWERLRRWRVEHLAIAITLLFDGIVLVDSTVLGLPVVRPAVGFVFLTFAIGGVFLAAVGAHPTGRVRWPVYAVGVSLLAVMLTGFLVNLAFLSAGIPDPLSAGPLVATLSALTVGTGLVSLRRRSGPALGTVLPDRDATLAFLRRDGLQIGGLSLLPVGGMLSVVYLNASFDAVPLLAVLAALAVVPLLVVSGVIEERYFALAACAIGVTLLYHKGLWVGQIYGGHLSTVTVYEQGVWRLSRGTLLPNTILMPAYARVLDLGIITQVKVVMPAMVAFVPLALYVMLRTYVPPVHAFLGTALFVFAHPFYFQYPSTPRASMPVLFLLLIGVTMSDVEIDRIVRRGLSILFAAGLAVSHYGTSYYVMFAMMGGVAVLVHFDVVDRVLGSRATGRRSSRRDRAYERLSNLSRGNTISMAYVGFYATVVMMWYYYIDRQNSKFISLAENVTQSIASLFGGTGRGSTAVRLATDYGGLSIRYSKYLYVAIAGIVGLGLLFAFVRRYVPRWESEFPDEYLAFASLLFVLFGGTLIMSGQWGGGRPMMIVLTFNAIFAVVAVTALGQWVTGGMVAAARRVSDRAADALSHTSDRLPGEATMATVLAVFLLMNTGFMAAVAYGGDAPSSVPQTDAESTYNAYDIDTHAWLADHRDGDYEIYGDRNARAQTTDWMNGEIAAQSERRPYRFKKSNLFDAVDDPELERGYLLFMAHNVRDRRVVVDYVTTRPLSEYDLQTARRNRIYSNGAGRVYFVGNATSEFMDRGGAGS